MKTLKPLIIGFGLLATCISAGCENETSLAEPEVTKVAETTYPGENVKFCDGTLQSFVTLDGNQKPIKIGIRFHEKILKNLPSDPAKNIPEAVLQLPAEGQGVGIDHIDFGWNPAGHEPDPIYTLPHFDLHFYMVTRQQQAAVVPGPDPIVVEPRFIPQNYVSGVVAVPNMGVHYVDVTSGEFNGFPFTSTYIYGFYQGKMTFGEPMFTRAFLLTKPDFSAPVKQPAQFQKAGYYPQSYRIAYNSSTQEYVISLEGLKYQEAAN